MIIMGIDYGDVRTGISVCDKNEILATALCTIEESYEPKLINKICELAQEKGVQQFVVGKPVNMDGTVGDRAKKCIAFADKLSETAGLPVNMYDERLTTVTAHRELSVTNTRGKKRKSVVDALSAQIILQNYIDSIKK
jgi:putative Holliday junction resolvase